MATLPELQAYIVANATGFKAASSTGPEVPIFLGAIPAEQPDRVVALFEAGGLSPQNTMNSTTIDHERPSIQVLNRANAYTDARSDARRIFRTLNGIVNSTLTGTLYTSVAPIQQPFDLPQDSKDRQVFSCNYSVTKADS